jgi:hypothetical protein
MENNVLPQENLFRKIRTILPPHVSMVDEISEILQISSDSAYRRIRCDKILLLDEFLLLCRHFKISVDDLLQSGSGLICFQSNSLDEKSLDFENYLQAIREDLYRLSKQNNPHIYLIFNELNLFQMLMMPTVAAFKIFFWSKSHFGLESYRDQLYSSGHLTKTVLGLIQDVENLYFEIPTTELFTLEALASILKQLDFYHDAGFFSDPDDVRVVCTDLSRLLTHIKQQAELGYKFKNDPAFQEGSYNLYFNDLVIVDNTVVVSSDQTKVSYITCNSVNLLISDNQKFYDNNMRWAKNLISKSTLISGAAERERNRCFKILDDQVCSLRDKICK